MSDRPQEPSGHESLERGMEQAARGEVVDLGRFSQYDDRVGPVGLPELTAERMRAVYWHDAPACRARGSQHAECALEPDHDGPHIGNGYDDLGPLTRCWPNESSGGLG